MVVLPAVSVPALSAFSEAFGLLGRPHPLCDERQSHHGGGHATGARGSHPRRLYIGLLSGDYVMVAKKDTDQLAKSCRISI